MTEFQTEEQKSVRALADALIQSTETDDTLMLTFTHTVPVDQKGATVLVGEDAHQACLMMTLIIEKVIESMVEVMPRARALALNELAEEKKPAPPPFKDFYTFDEPLPAGRHGVFNLFVDGVTGPVGSYLVPMTPFGAYRQSEVDTARNRALIAYCTHLGLPTAA